MEIELYKPVILKEDIPEKKLKAGRRGVVVHIFDKPNRAYEVEFCSKDGETIATHALLPNQIERMEK